MRRLICEFPNIRRTCEMAQDFETSENHRFGKDIEVVGAFATLCNS